MKSKKISYIWISPLITLIIMLALYAASGIYPFGTATTAFSDGMAQYLPFMAELAEKIREGGSLFFTWHAGRGMNLWSNIAYYAISPLNLIAVFFEPSEMGDAFALITLIKPVLMAFTFGVFLKYAYKKNDLSVVVFSVLWSLSSFMLGGIFFTSWYDAIIYFPLVILGLEKMMDGKSGAFYSFFLALSIISNFYMGWIICIFSVIYFIYSFIADDEVSYEGTGVSSEDGGEETINIFATLRNSYLLNTFFRFVASSLIAGGLSAAVILPVSKTLANTGKGTIHNDLFNLDSDGIWGIFASHVYPLKNTFETFVLKDFIFAFAGIATLILAVAYFFSKGVSARKKVGNAMLLLVMWLSIAFHAPWFVWHGFGEPAGLMYRFAFIYSFVLLKIAYEAFINIKNIPIYGILSGTVFAGFCTGCMFFNDSLKDTFDVASAAVKVGLTIAVFTVLLLLMTKKAERKNILTALLLLAVVGESVMLNFGNLNTMDTENNLSEEAVVKKASEKLKDGEYLTFTSGRQTYNNMIMYNLIYGYNGSECFSSMSDVNFAMAASNMGAHGNRLNSQNGAQEQTPLYNMVFRRGIISTASGRLSENSFRKKLGESDGYTLFENNYTMPFMYTASYGILDWTPYSFPIMLDCQNEAVRALTGTEDAVASYNKAENFVYENCSYMSAADRIGAEEESHEGHTHESNGYYEFLESKMYGLSYEIEDMTKSASLTFDSVAQNDGLMYIYVDTNEFVDLTVELNGVTKKYLLYGIDDERTYELGEVKKGDRAKITIGGYLNEGPDGEDVYALKHGNLTALPFTVDAAKFDKAYKKLDSMSDTEILEFGDTHIKAKVTSYEDGILYIPTPYDEGWKIFVDGAEAPLYKQKSHILMTEISAGEHTVEMKYVPLGFAEGVAVTAVCAVIFAVWTALSVKRFKKEQKSGIIGAKDLSEE